MIHGIANGGTSSKGKPFNRQFFEYRNFLKPADISSSFATPVLADGKYDYWTTLQFDEPGIYQYRLKVTTNYSVTSSYYEEKFGDWIVVNTSENNCNLVPPCFFNINSGKSGNLITLSAICVEGEEVITETGIEYKVGNSSEYNSLIISYMYPSNGTLSYDFGTLVNGYDYYCRFYVKCRDTIYYSDNIWFDADGNSETISGLDLVSEDKSSVIDYSRPLDIIIYSVEGKKLYTYEQIYFSFEELSNSVSKGIYIIECIQNGKHVTKKYNFQ